MACELETNNPAQGVIAHGRLVCERWLIQPAGLLAVGPASNKCRARRAHGKSRAERQWPNREVPDIRIRLLSDRLANRSQRRAARISRVNDHRDFIFAENSPCCADMVTVGVTEDEQINLVARNEFAHSIHAGSL